MSKLSKTKALLAVPELKKLVPVTRPFSKPVVKDLLTRYGMVYVKPVKGSYGRGVIRVEHRKGHPFPYQFQAGVRKYRYKSFADMYPMLVQAKEKKAYLVQQGIEMLRHRNRRFDLRLMVQKNPSSKWESTGLIGRLAHPKKIVTNYHNGGTPMAAEILFSTHMTKAELTAYRKRLNTLGISIASAMERKFPGIKEIGVDLAVDARKTPWILEVNTKPDPYIFLKLADRSVFRKIYRYCMAYGRYQRKPATRKT